MVVGIFLEIVQVDDFKYVLGKSNDLKNKIAGCIPFGESKSGVQLASGLIYKWMYRYWVKNYFLKKKYAFAELVIKEATE